MEILYEDSGCFVVNKPAGVVVHPGEGGMHCGKTVVDIFAEKIEKGVGAPGRPGIVHRLDKNTSGVLVIAKNEAAYNDLVAQFKEHAIEKIYLGLVRGKMENDEAIIDSPIARSYKDRKKMGVSRMGKEAVTEYKVLESYDGVSLLEVRIKTGRTHQIRVHMAAIGHPIVGDKEYGDKQLNREFEEKFGLERQFLHAVKLKFKSPATGKMVEVEAGLPVELSKVLAFSV